MKKIIIHPFLFGIFPVLFFYSKNAWLFSWKDPLFGLAIVFLFAFSVWLGLGKIIQDYQKSAIIVSAFLLIFFSFGPIINILKDLSNLIRIRHIFFALAVVFVLILYFALKTRRNLNELTKILNLTSIFLILMPIFNISVYNYNRIMAGRQINNEVAVQGDGSSALINDDKKPDIYYIILDSYAHKNTLEESFGYSNDDFYNYLTSKGFYIASESRSNYSHTPLSLSSSLNMKYIDYLVDENGSKSKNLAPLHALIENNEVQHFLKSKGYRYININSGFGPTKVNRFADINYSMTSTEFLKNDFLISLLFYQNYIFQSIYPIETDLPSFNNRDQVLYAFDKLKEIADRYKNDPVFVFAHILSPHPPLLDKDCNNIDYDLSQNFNKFYIEKLICTNKNITEVIDEILYKSNNKAIIILQSDHGQFAKDTPLLSSVDIDEMQDVNQIPPQFSREVLRNLSAYYLPDDGENVFYKSVTPVNSFRLIFNYYFGTDYEILEDRSYITPDSNFEYNFFDVTDIVKF